MRAVWAVWRKGKQMWNVRICVLLQRGNGCGGNYSGFPKSRVADQAGVWPRKRHTCFVDPLESAETALCREIKEELELEIVSKDYKGSFPNTYVYGGVMYFTCDMVYECTVASYEHIAANDDVVAAQFYKITEQVIEQVGAESIRKILRRFCLK